MTFLGNFFLIFLWLITARADNCNGYCCDWRLREGILRYCFEIGYSLAHFFKRGYSSAHCIKIRYISTQCIKIGYSSAQYFKIGYFLAQSIKIGYSSAQCIKIGYSSAQCIKIRSGLNDSFSALWGYIEIIFCTDFFLSAPPGRLIITAWTICDPFGFFTPADTVLIQWNVKRYFGNVFR